MSDNPKKIVLAYSGGLDTSVILGWLIDTYGCEVITFTADLAPPSPPPPVDDDREPGSSSLRRHLPGSGGAGVVDGFTPGPQER